MAEAATTSEQRSTPAERLRLTGLELAGAGGLTAMIAIHVAELAGKTDEVAYLGFGYLALSVASVLAILMIVTRDPRGWRLAGATAAATLAGYVLTRTTGLPGSTDDIGNWRETLAVWAMLAELGVCIAAGLAIGGRRRA